MNHQLQSKFRTCLITMLLIVSFYVSSDILVRSFGTSLSEAAVSRFSSRFASDYTEEVFVIRNVDEARRALRGISDQATMSFLKKVIMTYSAERTSVSSYGSYTYPEDDSVPVWPDQTTIIVSVGGTNPSISIQKEYCLQNFEIEPLTIKIKTEYDVKKLLEEGGVCTIMATIHSVLKMFSLPVDMYSSDGGKTLKKEFINSFPNSLGSDIDPMTAAGLKAMHENFSYNGETLACTDLSFPREGTVEDLKKLCDDLAAKVEKMDCSVAMNAPFHGSGHAVNYAGTVKWNDKTKQCETQTTATDRPSSDGSMNDVAVKPDLHTWNIGVDPAAIGGLDFIPVDTGGRNKVWEEADYSFGSFYCCEKKKETAE